MANLRTKAEGQIGIGKRLGEVHGDVVSDMSVVSLVHTSGADARAVEAGMRVAARVSGIKRISSAAPGFVTHRLALWLHGACA